MIAKKDGSVEIKAWQAVSFMLLPLFMAGIAWGSMMTTQAEHTKILDRMVTMEYDTRERIMRIEAWRDGPPFSAPLKKD